MVAGSSYRVSGTNTAGDAVSNIDSQTAALDMGTNAILGIHPSNNDLALCGSSAIRLIRGWP